MTEIAPTATSRFKKRNKMQKKPKKRRGNIMWHMWIGWLMTCPEFEQELADGGGEPDFAMWWSVQSTKCRQDLQEVKYGMLDLPSAPKV